MVLLIMNLFYNRSTNNNPDSAYRTIKMTSNRRYHNASEIKVMFYKAADLNPDSPILLILVAFWKNEEFLYEEQYKLLLELGTEEANHDGG